MRIYAIGNRASLRHARRWLLACLLAVGAVGVWCPRSAWASGVVIGVPSLAADIDPGSVSSDPGGLTAVTGSTIEAGTGAVRFAATDAAHGRELWASDGTRGGTTLLADIDPGAASSDPECDERQWDHVLRGDRSGSWSRVVEERWNRGWDRDGQGHQSIRGRIRGRIRSA